MGFWNTFFSSQICKNCGSYDTVEHKVTDELYWEINHFCNYEGTMKKAYRCEKCGMWTIISYDNKIFWTTRK